MQQYAIDYDYGKLNNNDGANGYRDYGRVNWAGKSYNAGSLALEHTMYTNADNIANYINSQNVDMNRTYNSTFFNFVDYRLGTTRDLSNSLDSAYSDKYGPVVSDGQYVEIVHSQSYKTRFIYDESTNQYKMQQNYSDGQWRDTVDEAADNKVLTFPNVIVLYTDIHTYPGHEKTDRMGRRRLLLLRRQVRVDLLAEGHPAGGPAPVLPERGRHLQRHPAGDQHWQELCGRDRRRLCRKLCPQHAGRRQPVHRHDPDLREELRRGRRQGR